MISRTTSHACIAGIGVDIISHKRIREFLSRHPGRAPGLILSASEKKYFKKKTGTGKVKSSRLRLSTQLFARFFAAKEAYFKACGGQWMGRSGFRHIHVVCVGAHRFRVTSNKGFKSFRHGRAEGLFYSSPRWTVAEIICWKES